MKLKENLNELWCNKDSCVVMNTPGHSNASNQCIFVVFPVMLSGPGILQRWTLLWVKEMHMKNKKKKV